MLDQLKSSLLRYIHDSEDDDVISRRQYARREADHCICEIEGKSFPVQNWSQGGALIYGDDRTFGAGQLVNVNMKFKLRNMIIDIKHKATILRKTNGYIAMQYMPLTDLVKTKFQQVVDDCIAGEFAGSQA